MGEFNEVRSKQERYGSVFNVQSAAAFNNFISLASPIDLPLDGYAYTWVHKSATKMSKLDRFLISKGLIASFPHLSALCLDKHLSYHRPILMREMNINYGHTPWSNEAIINDRSILLKELQDIISMESEEVAQKAKVCWAIEISSVDIGNFWRMIFQLLSWISSLQFNWKTIKAIHGEMGALGSLDTIPRRSPWLEIIREINILRSKGIDILSLIRKKVVWSYRRDPRGGIEEDQKCMLLSRKSGIILPNMLDRWVWSLEASGEFSVKSARSLINDSLLPKEDVHTRWVKVVPIKINVFAWRVRLNKLPARLNLFLIGVEIPSIMCPLCNSSVESASHLFFSCHVARLIWRKVLRWWDLEENMIDSYDDWLLLLKNIRLAKRLKDIFEDDDRSVALAEVADAKFRRCSVVRRFAASIIFQILEDVGFRILHAVFLKSNIYNSCLALMVVVRKNENVFFTSFNGNVEAHRGASTSTGSTTFDNALPKEQMIKIMSLINEKPTGNVNANMAGKPTLTVPTKNMFNIIDISSLNLTIGYPNGALSKITTVGNLRLSADIVLFDVLVVPEYCVSLLSVYKLIKDSKLFVGFDKHKCYIQDLNLIKTVGIGNESSGLYMFDEDKKCKNISLKYDKHVSPCDICHKANQTRDPFPLSDHKSMTIGDLVHLDLWGPYRVFESENSQLVSQSESELNLLNFFDNFDDATLKSPNDDERDPSVGDGNVMASPDIDNSPPVSREATFETQLDETNNIFKGSSVEMSGSRSGIESQSKTNNEDESQIVRKSSIVSNLPSKFNDFILPSNKNYGIEKHVNYSKLSTIKFCFATNLNKSVEPKSYVEAAQNKHWVEAMNNEMEALFRDNTWILTDLPVTKKTIGCKWLFKIKYKSSGEIERYKARLVAKGFSQRKGIDYKEKFSPVVKMIIVRCIISLSMHNNWPLFQVDVNNSFLYGNLHEDGYMDLPPGYYDKSQTKIPLNHGYGS
ncbi:ribonuclease H-like domain-containing protein [Tanacetum coccineum]|uniref:Ribonuclease H-like domain-containing protein n=1 Tax=Tanacetum coccineum TaxID=301880 RepID=A0ABQ5G110_9ASTR